jgi:hypothetical protein
VFDVFLGVALAVLAAVYVSWRAGRLDRLHARTEGARSALEAALLRRNCVAVELASSGLLDPETSVAITRAAHDARAGDQQRELAESELSRALRAAFGQPGFRASLSGADGAAELLTELESAAYQVFLARKFYNDAVAAANSARRRMLVRALHLAGRAPAPEFFEIDDSLVAGPAGDGADMPRLTG